MDERKVTAITAQKRNPNRVNVFLDGEYSFSLSRFVAAWLEPGKTLDQKQIDTLIEKDGEEKALQSAMRLLSHRPRSEKEVRFRLQQKGYKPETIDLVVEKLNSSNMLRDDQFAELWIDSRNEFHPRSHRLMRFELKSKGIDDKKIDKALESSANDQELAQKAASKAARRYQGMDWLTFRTKMSAHLARRGFTYDVIFPVVKKLWNEMQSENNLTGNEELEK